MMLRGVADRNSGVANARAVANEVINPRTMERHILFIGPKVGQMRSAGLELGDAFESVRTAPYRERE